MGMLPITATSHETCKGKKMGKTKGLYITKNENKKAWLANRVFILIVGLSYLHT